MKLYREDCHRFQAASFFPTSPKNKKPERENPLSNFIVSYHNKSRLALVGCRD